MQAADIKLIQVARPFMAKGVRARPRFITATMLALLCATMPAQAMSEKDAAQNLTRFAFAMKEGELCEKLGFPGMTALKSWEQRNGDVLVKSLRRIEQHAVDSRQIPPEQASDVALGFFIRSKERFDRELAPRSGPKTCAVFGQRLRDYEVNLIRQ